VGDVQGKCEELEKLGMIFPSEQSKYASATLLVKKKDEKGEYTKSRICGDYRPINKATIRDKYRVTVRAYP